MIDLKVKKLHPDARIPTYATDGSACFDLYALHVENSFYEDGTKISVDQNWLVPVKPLYPQVFGTGLSFEVPEGYVLMVFSRSGHGFAKNIRLSNATGIIDSDYRGELKIKLISDKTEDLWDPKFEIRKFDRIAQAMLVSIPKINFLEVQELADTNRGISGFGSTGK